MYTGGVRTWLTLASALATATTLAVGCTALFPFDLDEGAGAGANVGGQSALGGGQAEGGEGGEAPAGCTSHEGCPTFASDGPCQTTTCMEGTCMVVVNGAGTPAGTEVVGDCQRSVCDDAGAVVLIVDDSDVPVDGNECTADTCSRGTPSNPPESDGTPCGMGGLLVCNDAGACVGCNNDDDCLADEDCLDRFCDTGTTQCDVTVLPNNAPCTSDGVFCNGAETCQNATCTSPGNPCPGADGDGDCSEMCNEDAGACSGNDPNGSNCNNGAFCDGPDTCNNGMCQGAGNPCPGADGDGNCSESCSETNDNCAAKDPDNSACNDNIFCNGADKCVSGACSSHTGDPCESFPGCGPTNCSQGCSETDKACNLKLLAGDACNCLGFCLQNGLCFQEDPF